MAHPAWTPLRARSRRVLEAMERLQWPGDAVLVAGKGACHVCRAAAGLHARQAVPAIPVRGCRSHRGCRCWIAAVLPVADEPPRQRETA